MARTTFEERLKAMTLPGDAVDLLSGNGKASDVKECLLVAYWLHGRDNDAALQMMRYAHECLRNLADAMGYGLTVKEAAE